MTARKRGLSRAAGLVALAVALGFSFLLWRGAEPGGIDDAYAVLFGPADLGPVDFAALTRRSAPNDALACPVGLCPKAEADLVPPVFDVPGERLRAIVAEVAAAEPNTEPALAAEGEEQDRYVARSRLMRFPDTVDVRIVREGEGRSTLALYSRSQIGYSDLGVNRARIERWLEAIRARAAESPPPTTEG